MDQRSLKKTAHMPGALGELGDSKYSSMLLEANSCRLMTLNRFWEEAIPLSVFLVLDRLGTHLAVVTYDGAAGTANRRGLPLANSWA